MSAYTFDRTDGLEAGNGVLNVEHILLLTDEPFPEIISLQISEEYDYLRYDMQEFLYRNLQGGGGINTC